jgi:hypothetical protein
MDHLLQSIQSLPPERIQVLARPIGLLCMELVLQLELPANVRKVCTDVERLLRDETSTSEQLHAAAYAAFAAAYAARAAYAAYAAFAAAYAARAAYAAFAAAYAARAADAAFAAAYAARAADAARAAANAAAQECFIARLALLVG